MRSARLFVLACLLAACASNTAQIEDDAIDREPSPSVSSQELPATPVAIVEPTGVALETFERSPSALTVDLEYDDLFMESVLAGPDGAELVVYDDYDNEFVLTIPSGALDQDEVITMTPLFGIDGLPLSQGSVGAVLIEPEGLWYDIPATLTFNPAEPADLDEGSVEIGFSFDADGSEFHLYPSDAEGQAGLGGLLFSPARGSGSRAFRIRENRGYGVGRGTTAGAAAQLRNQPSRLRSQANQVRAARGIDELAPLVLVSDLTDSLARLGERAASSGASSWEAFSEQFADLAELGSERDMTPQERAEFEKTASEIALNAAVLLERAISRCQEDRGEFERARHLLDKLVNGRSDIHQVLRDQIGRLKGSGYLADLQAQARRCVDQAWQVSGRAGPLSFRGTICGPLEASFQLVGAGGDYSGIYRFAGDGTFTYRGAGSGYRINGSGTYEIAPASGSSDSALLNIQEAGATACGDKCVGGGGNPAVLTISRADPAICTR